MTYTRIAGDEEYRAVSLANSIVPKFTPFRNDSQTINYVGDTVLEIKRTDGSTSLIYDNGSNQKRKVAVRRSGNQIIVAGGIPTAGEGQERSPMLKAMMAALKKSLNSPPTIGMTK